MNNLGSAIVSLLKLALPLMVIQLSQVSLGFTDTIIAGQYFYKDLAAVGLGSNLWTPFGILMTGILYILIPKVSEVNLDDSKHKKSLSSLRAEGEKLALFVGVCAMVFILAISLSTSLFIDDEETANISSNYLIFIAFSMPGLALFIVYRFMCEGRERLKPVILAVFFLALFNPILNFVLVNGLFGFEKMGGAGCGLATFISTYLAFFVMRFLCRRNFPAIFIKPDETPKKNVWNKLLLQGLPIGVALILEVVAFTALALMAAQLGTRVIAAHQIAINITLLIFMIPVAISSASTIRVALFRGEKDRPSIVRTSIAAMCIATLYGIGMTLVLAIYGESLVNLFSEDREIISLVISVIFLIAAFQWFDAIQITASGILRGMDEFVKPLLAVFVTYWIFVVPTAYFIGVKGVLFPEFVGMRTIWIILSLGIILAAIVLCCQVASVLKSKEPETVEDNEKSVTGNAAVSGEY
ncbi:MATE family efflux transporter [Veronia pacifica]|uniref:Uncharacterized protein n=1 Tax=Veronia pacifica TaxID=1080227 RepID=A0A1C3EMA8_9GAMM|nr:MATE family efflux transporter [Veronia pacifica]ODA34370.1 hypothetical protein A8L45_06500 [Veronia pacifica]